MKTLKFLFIILILSASACTSGKFHTRPEHAATQNPADMKLQKMEIERLQALRDTIVEC